MKIYVGVDWAEEHHDIEVRDEAGQRLARQRIGNGVEGVRRLHETVGEFVEAAADVVVGIETDRGLLVSSLVAAGYQVYAVNPRSVDRYRDRHRLSGAKSDQGDAIVLAELVRTDRHHHRPIAGDSDDVQGLKVIARGHQNLVWARTRHVLQLRSVLIEFYPSVVAAADGAVGTRDALAILAVAPDPQRGARLGRSRIANLLKRAGRQRYLSQTTERFHQHLHSQHLSAGQALTQGYASLVESLVAIISELDTQIEALQHRLDESFSCHRDAEIYRSQPGLGVVLGARILAEFGDDPDRYDSVRSRRNYAGTSPITRASGKSTAVVARFIRNRRLADACDRWAFASLKTSPGARRYYDKLRDNGKTHGQALRALSNRLVGILHGCLEHRTPYDETIAWKRYEPAAA